MISIRIQQIGQKTGSSLMAFTEKHHQLILTKQMIFIQHLISDPPQDFNAKGESTRTTRFHFKAKEFILTRFSTLAILPH